MKNMPLGLVNPLFCKLNACAIIIYESDIYTVSKDDHLALLRLFKRRIM
jgi:hypothetical protein